MDILTYMFGVLLLLVLLLVCMYVCVCVLLHVRYLIVSLMLYFNLQCVQKLFR